VVLSGFELLGNRSDSKEVAMDMAIFVIPGKGFFLRYLRPRGHYSGYRLTGDPAFPPIDGGSTEEKSLPRK
jgi:hypothetical protein